MIWIRASIRRHLGLGAAVTVVLLASVVAVTAPESAGATYAGAANGEISFVSDRDPLLSGGGQAVLVRDQVFVMGPDGQNPTNLSTSSEDHSDPSFSADGRLIAFAGFPDTRGEGEEENEEIYAMNADGTDKRRLTTTSADESDPAFSPDGSRIAFTTLANGGFPGIDLVNSDGSGRTHLLQGSADVEYANPSWSPDGSKIAYERTELSGFEGQTDIWVIDLASGQQTRLTDGFEQEYDPDFSPDGSRIAYVVDPFIVSETKLVSNPDIWVMNADGSGKSRLTSDPWADSEPAWSPDGSEIAFTHRRNETDPHAYVLNAPSDVYVMNADGSDARNLTGGGRTGALGAQEEDNASHSPSWQPVGPDADRVPPSYAGTISVPPRLVVFPLLTQPGIAPRRGRGGIAIRFRLSERASAKLAVERLLRGKKVKRGGRTVCRAKPRKAWRKLPRRARCKRWKLQGWIVRNGRRGRNSVRFDGRIGRRALRAGGPYRIRAGAVDRAANPARQKQSRRFRLVG